MCHTDEAWTESVRPMNMGTDTHVRGIWKSMSMESGSGLRAGGGRMETAGDAGGHGSLVMTMSLMTPTRTLNSS